MPYLSPTAAALTSVCVTIEIPNTPQDVRNFYGAVWELSREYNYSDAPESVIRDVAYNWDNAHKTIRVEECVEPVEEQCVEYPPFNSAIEWFPETPYIIEPFDLLNWPPFLVIGVTIGGWLSDLLSFITSVLGLEDLLGQLSGYQDGDVITTLGNFESGFGIGGNLADIRAPGFKFSWTGAGTVELHLLEVLAGGYAYISLDSDPFAGDNFIGDLIEILDTIVDPDDQILDLERNLISVPFEFGSAERIIEMSTDQPGDHFISVRFLPNVSAELIPIGFGGGLRKIVLCTEDEQAGEEMFDLRVTANCGLEKTTNGGVTWEPVPGSENLIACQAAAFPTPIELLDVNETTNRIEYEKGGSTTFVDPRLVTNEHASLDTHVDVNGSFKHPLNPGLLEEIAKIGVGDRGLEIQDGSTNTFGQFVLAPYADFYFPPAQIFVDDYASGQRKSTISIEGGINADNANPNETAGYGDFKVTSGNQAVIFLRSAGTPQSAGGAARLGFYGNSPIARPIVTGEFDGGGGMASLLTALDNLGLIDLQSPTFVERALASTGVTDVTAIDCLISVWRDGQLWREIDMSDCTDLDQAWELNYVFNPTIDDMDLWSITVGFWSINTYGGALLADEDLITNVEGESSATLSWVNNYKLTKVVINYVTIDVSPAAISNNIGVFIGNPLEDSEIVAHTPPDENGLVIWESEGAYVEANQIRIGAEYSYGDGDDSPFTGMVSVHIEGIGDAPPKDPADE